MSYVNNDKKPQEHNYVITYKELLFTIFIFIVILVALYPKDLLKQQIVSEKANYDLSMLYLKNLLKHNPDDESLMLILATQSLKTGNKDLAIRLLELLFESKDEKIRQKAIMLSFELEKEKYFYIKNKKQKRIQLTKLRRLFLRIYNAKMYELDDAQKWYEEAVFVGAKYPAYTLLKRTLQNEEHQKNVTLLKEAFFLAVQFSKKKDAFHFLEELKKYDRKNYKKWILQEYYLDMKYKRYTAAEKILVAHQKNDDHIKSILGDFYFYRRRYKEASEIFFSLYKNAQSFREKKIYFKKALQALVAANDTQRVNQLVQENESKFLQDVEMRKFMLKIYLANGKLDKAAALSKKILRLKYNR